MGYQDVEPGDVLGTALSPLLRVPLKALTPYDAQGDVAQESGEVRKLAQRNSNAVRVDAKGVSTRQSVLKNTSALSFSIPSNSSRTNRPLRGRATTTTPSRSYGFHSPEMSFIVGLETLDLCSTETVSVQYEDRKWEIALQSETNMFCEASSSIAVDLQAALNLAKPPVGLRLRVAEGADAILCPMSALLACPSYIAKTFQGMSWVPLMEGEDNTGFINDDVNVLPPPPPPPADSPMPPPLRSPIEPEISSLELCGSTASPSEGCGRPLTAPPSDRGRFMLRPRPGKREGHGRPLSATPSDKSFGMRRIRPAKREGFGRPSTALPSDHSGCGIGCSSSPHGFRCEETADEVWPPTEPSFDMGSNRCSWSSLDGQRLTELCEGDAGWLSFAKDDEHAVGGDIWASDTRKPPRECWV